MPIADADHEDDRSVELRPFLQADELDGHSHHGIIDRITATFSGICYRSSKQMLRLCCGCLFLEFP